ERNVIAVTGDAGFMMNSQEIETALRMKTPFVILIWNDAEDGLINWHQLRHFGRRSHISFANPDFVKYADSFGAKGYRVERAADLVPTLKRAFADNTVVVVDCPVDYSENMKLTQRLKNLTSPLAGRCVPQCRKRWARKRPTRKRNRSRSRSSSSSRRATARCW